MNDEQLMVRDFHQHFGLPSSDRPSWPGEAVHRLRVLLIEEELAELRNSGESRNLVAVADALADLLYVVYGAGETYGIDLQPVFREIHRSNMSKGDPEIVRMQAGTAFAHFLAGRDEEASSWAQKALRGRPSYLTALRLAAASSAFSSSVSCTSSA